MPRPTRRPATALVVAAAVVACLTGCRGGGGVAASGTVAPEVPTTTIAAGASSSTSSASRRSTTTDRASTRAGGTTTTASGGAKPKVVVAQQGDEVVAVFVATGASLDEPAFTQAVARLKALGYPAYSGGDTGCSRGAEEALPQLGQYSVSVEFATRADADRFAALFGQVVGIASVTVYCAD